MSSEPRSAREHACLPLAQWPVRDRRAWDQANRRPDFLDEGGAVARWRAATQRSASGAYGRWLNWLAAQGVSLEREDPVARLNEERLRRYLAFLAARRAPCTVVGYICALVMALKAMFPGSDWRWLQRVHNNLQRQARPTRDKWARLIDARDARQLGLDLVAQAAAVLDDQDLARTAPRRRLAAARDFRDGLLIGLLAFNPLRVKNLLGTDIGRHLRRSGARVTLSFGAEETKTDKPIETTWPVSLVPALDRYLAEVRPILLAAVVPVDPARPPQPAANRLWVGQGGTALTPGGLQKALMRHTRRRFGHYINAHAFRVSAASTVANADPDRMHLAQHVLQHASSRTTEASYVLTDARLALRAHHDLIATLRKTARRRRKIDQPRGS